MGRIHMRRLTQRLEFGMSDNGNKSNKNNTGSRTSGKSSRKGKSSSGKKSSSRRKSRKGSKRRIIILSTILALSCIALLVILFFYMKFGESIKQYQVDAKVMVDKSTKDSFKQSQTSLVYDHEDELVSVIRGEKDVYYIPFQEIPDGFKKAMMSIEDKKFLNHNGVDLKANIRAVLELIKNKGEIKQGASTITQQLARNIFLTHEVSYERKLKEIFIALEIEKKYSKNDIMEFYLNNVYFANGYYGIGAASNGYFNKDVKELTISEMAFLCAIPNNPTVFNPVNKIENTISRRDRILTHMYEDGVLGKEEYNRAKTEEMILDIQKIEKINYVETFVFYSAIQALMMQEGFILRNTFDSEEDRISYEEAYEEAYSRIQQSIYTKGYRIYTAMDLDKQEQLQEAVNNELSKFEEVNGEGTYTLQGAAVSIDNKTGKVVAIVGGREQDTGGYTLNRGYQSFRQPGSAIKPLIVYAPVFERNVYPDTLVMDEKFEGGPTNSNKKYSGEITVRYAVEVSKNTIAWKLFEEMSPRVGIEYLLDMGFTKIHKNDYYPASSLGGMTQGVSPLEITSAFATLANDGLYRIPTTIVRITDAAGNVIVDNSRSEEKRVYEANSARMMTDVLEGVMTSGTGRGLGISGMPSAGKTGTTNDRKDGWFVGYSPYYTTGVWVGYDIPKEMSDLSGASYPGRIWKTFMNQAHEGLSRVEFLDYLDTRPSPTPTPTVEPSIEPTMGAEDSNEVEDEVIVDASDDDNVENEIDKEITTPVATIAPTPTPIEEELEEEDNIWQEDDGSDSEFDDLGNQDEDWQEPGDDYSDWNSNTN